MFSQSSSTSCRVQVGLFALVYPHLEHIVEASSLNDAIDLARPSFQYKVKYYSIALIVEISNPLHTSSTSSIVVYVVAMAINLLPPPYWLHTR